MWYSVSSQDVENSLEKRLSARPAHLARLEALKQQGRLLLAGPHPAIDSETPGEAGFRCAFRAGRSYRICDDGKRSRAPNLS